MVDNVVLGLLGKVRLSFTRCWLELLNELPKTLTSRICITEFAVTYIRFQAFAATV
jgi:hypothetical protein